ATTFSLIFFCLGGMGLCGLFGVFSGVMVTAFRIPAFICTLGVMMIARGLALTIAPRENISVDAAGIDWLGSQSSLFGVPNPVMLMIFLFIGAHILMTRTTLGRYIYAVGGNPEAARLSGVPVKWVLVFVYALCGLLAGVAGIINASLFGNGNPRFGEGEELQVIAAVVVGGTSLAGGEGRILGTLIGALIIAVIYSGMNQTGVGEHMQKVVFGLLILAAVLLDQLKKRGLK
ncbi:MAG: ABC transporter permease, partial [Verrucomicrobiales bacterium]|nr:ABC transporter permease [Verrucomicrobiales bacterium]